MLRLHSRSFVQGIRAALPLCLGAAPFAISYALAARQAGLSLLDTQMMSLTVYSGAMQMSLLQLLPGGASLPPILLTALALNLHHFLYGLSLARRIEFSWPERVLAAYFLTDGSYGVTVSGTGANFSRLLGAELSLFVVWNVFTALGLLIGQLLVIPTAAHLEFVAPLTFFVLLISLFHTGTDVLVAVVSTLGALLCLTLHLNSATLFIVGILGAALGAYLIERQQRHQNRVLKADRP